MFWTTSEIAEKTGLTARHISRLCKHGTIKADKKGHDYWIDDEEARRFIEAHKQGK